MTHINFALGVPRVIGSLHVQPCANAATQYLADQGGNIRRDYIKTHHIYAALFTCIFFTLNCTLRPALVASVVNASRLNLLSLPRIKSFRRGRVIPRRVAASACVMFQLSTIFSIELIKSERNVRFKASSGVLAKASHTFSNFIISTFNQFISQFRGVQIGGLESWVWV
jgi:hypothetical protein